MKSYTIKTSRETLKNCRLWLGQYITGNLAIEVYCDDDYFTTLTVNLPEERKLLSDEAFVDINNNPWALDFITENKLGKNTGEIGISGMCIYPLVKFDLQTLMYGEQKIFLKKCLEGTAKLSELEDYVERWHEGDNGDMSLQRFLGLTDKEYDAWAKNDDEIFEEFLAARKEGRESKI